MKEASKEIFQTGMKTRKTSRVDHYKSNSILGRKA